jgi:hypothetical protein
MRDGWPDEWSMDEGWMAKREREGRERDREREREREREGRKNEGRASDIDKIYR